MHRTIRLPLCMGLLAAATCLSFTQTLSASLPEEARNLVKEWVRVKALYSEEAETWAMEKVQVTDTISLLEAEKAMLEEQIAQREEAAVASQSKRTELSVRKEALEGQASALAAILTTYESELAAWVPSLPDILKEELSPLIRRLPKEGESLSSVGLGRRLQTVVGILSQVDKFNSSLTFRSELRENPETGASRETDTLYFGLAYAVFADAEGSYAGFGKPGADGWIWQPANESAEEISELIAIYKNDAPATYVSIPVSIE